MFTVSNAMLAASLSTLAFSDMLMPRLKMACFAAMQEY
jgi:hypothetical protein